MEPTDLRTTIFTHAGAPRVEVTTYAELCDLARETAAFTDLPAEEREIVEDLLDRWHNAKCHLAALPPDVAARLRAAGDGAEDFIERLDALEGALAGVRRGR